MLLTVRNVWTVDLKGNMTKKYQKKKKYNISKETLNKIYNTQLKGVVFMSYEDWVEMNKHIPHVQPLLNDQRTNKGN